MTHSSLKWLFINHFFYGDGLEISFFVPERGEKDFFNPVPPDTVFLLHLEEEIFDTNCLQEESMIIKPWIDRWVKERMEVYDSTSKKGFKRYMNQVSCFIDAPNVLSRLNAPVSRLGFDDLEIVEDYNQLSE